MSNAPKYKSGDRVRLIKAPVKMGWGVVLAPFGKVKYYDRLNSQYVVDLDEPAVYYAEYGIIINDIKSISVSGLHLSKVK